MKIEHIALWTRDLERLRSFYMTYFAATSNELYANPQKGFSSYFLSFDSGARLELMKMDAAPGSTDEGVERFAGYAHLAMSVGSSEEVDGLTRRLVADGYNCLDGPRTTGDGYYESVILDPDGNRIEITV